MVGRIVFGLFMLLVGGALLGWVNGQFPPTNDMIVMRSWQNIAVIIVVAWLAGLR